MKILRTLHIVSILTILCAPYAHSQEKTSSVEKTKPAIPACKPADIDCRIAALTKLIQSDPNNFALYRDRGDLYYEKLNYDKARTDYLRAIELNPKDPVSHCGIGNIYQIRGAYEKSIEKYKIALEIENGNPYFHYVIGRAFHFSGKHDEAVVDFDRAIELYADEEKFRSHVSRGLSLRKLGREDEAAHSFFFAIENLTAIINKTQAAGEDKELARYLLSRGISFRQMKDPVRAMDDYNRAITLDGKEYEIYLYRGIAYANNNDFYKAIDDFTRVIDINPEYADAYLKRSQMYKILGDTLKSYQDIAKFNELARKP